MPKLKKVAPGQWIMAESFWERHKLLPKVTWIGEPNSWRGIDYGHVYVHVAAEHKKGTITLEIGMIKTTCRLIYYLFHEFAHFLIWRLKLPKFLNEILDFKVYYTVKPLRKCTKT